MGTKNMLTVSVLSLCGAMSGNAQELPKATRPEDVGFSAERLTRITKYFQSEVERGSLPGVVVIVARNGRVAYSQAAGYQNREKKIAMRPDTIFRIYSMTKPIVAVAAMMLAEEGKIDLLAPVAQYLPEFQDVKVGVERKDPNTNQTVLALED